MQFGLNEGWVGSKPKPSIPGVRKSSNIRDLTDLAGQREIPQAIDWNRQSLFVADDAKISIPAWFRLVQAEAPCSI